MRYLAIISLLILGSLGSCERIETPTKVSGDVLEFAPQEWKDKVSRKNGSIVYADIAKQTISFGNHLSMTVDTNASCLDSLRCEFINADTLRIYFNATAVNYNSYSFVIGDSWGQYDHASPTETRPGPWFSQDFYLYGVNYSPITYGYFNRTDTVSYVEFNTPAAKVFKGTVVGWNTYSDVCPDIAIHYVGKSYVNPYK